MIMRKGHPGAAADLGIDFECAEVFVPASRVLKLDEVHYTTKYINTLYTPLVFQSRLASPSTASAVLAGEEEQERGSSGFFFRTDTSIKTKWIYHHHHSTHGQARWKGPHGMDTNCAGVCVHVSAFEIR